MTEYTQEERDNARFQVVDASRFDGATTVAINLQCALNRKTAELDAAMRLLREGVHVITNRHGCNARPRILAWIESVAAIGVKPEDAEKNRPAATPSFEDNYDAWVEAEVIDTRKEIA